jgi:hypothetical protein
VTWIKRYDNTVPSDFSYIELEDLREIAVRGSGSTWNIQGFEKATGSLIALYPVPYATETEADAALAKLYGIVGAIDLSA